MPGIPGWFDDQRAEQRGDLVAGERDQIVAGGELACSAAAVMVRKAGASMARW